MLGPVPLLPVLEVPITDALGCVSAVDVATDRDVPAYRQAVAAGFALNAADASQASRATPVILPVDGEVAAGAVAEPVAAGHCVRIAAGAQLPPNTDAAIAAAECQIDDGKVILHRPPVAGEGLRGVGSQFVAGETVVVRGQRLGHVAIAELALIGRPRIVVHPRPRVIIVTIGSELARVSAAPGPTSINDATGVLLTTTASKYEVDCHRVGPIADDRRAVRDAIEDQLVRADIVVTAGGIDGDEDVLRKELTDAGLARFDGPALEPCGAYGVGRIGPDRTPIVALPGDPVLALLAFHALVRPIIASMQGREPESSRVITPPRRAVGSGSRLVPGSFAEGRFLPVAAQTPSLRDLADVTAIAIHHAGDSSAEVVEWLY